MADISMGPDGRFQGVNASRMMTYAGGVMSLALVVGVGVWGAKLVMRDVSGIPLVAAIDEPMRIAPENPGGDIADHTGLSVNALVAAGAAAPGEDQVMLAPQETELQRDDLIVEADVVEAAAPADRLGRVVSSTPQEVVEVALQRQPVSADQGVQALVDQILAQTDEPPLAPMDVDDTDRVVVKINGSAVATRAAPIGGSGLAVARAERPQIRPASLRRAVTTDMSVAAAVSNAGSAAQAVDPDSIPAGTPLVQFGAYDSAEKAMQEWQRISGRFDDYMGGKSQVVQRAQSGGKTFYRLRAVGFADLSDARRFCSALVAEKADCIPVVTR